MDFEWDEDNIRHITRRNISPTEVEEALLEPDGVFGRAYDEHGRRRESRIGRTRAGRLLFVVYTELEDGRIRPFHARNADRRDRREYENR